jgi:hypothetical protein
MIYILLAKLKFLEYFSSHLFNAPIFYNRFIFADIYYDIIKLGKVNALKFNKDRGDEY